MSSAQSNKFYVVVVTSKHNDQPVEYFTYGRKQHASSRRTQERNWYNGNRDAKVFECLYSLGCLVATELDYTEYDAKRAARLAKR